jgi:hypothetical protein
MARREPLVGGGACYSERTDWTFGAGDTGTAGGAAEDVGAPDLPFGITHTAAGCDGTTKPDVR